MNQGTSDQIYEVRYRRKVWIATCVGFGIVWIAVTMMFELLVGTMAATEFAIIMWFLGSVSLAIFTFSYWRCPQCKHYFTKASFGRYCENCGTNFTPNQSL